MTTIYYTGDGADAIGVVVDFFAFFFFAFFTSAFAGAAGVAVAAFAAGAAGRTLSERNGRKCRRYQCRYPMLHWFNPCRKQKTTPVTRVDAINGRMTKKVDIVATWRTTGPPLILPEQSKN